MQTIDKKIGVLLLNLGGPDSLDAVRPFLYNLFSDRDIIRLGPAVLQKPIAWFISTFRSGKTRKMYSQIGNKSPLPDITRAQAAALETRLNSEESGQMSLLPDNTYKVYIGMRYWRPFIGDTVRQILNDGIKKLIVLNLYPHYSKVTTGSSVAECSKHITDTDIDVLYINEWYDFPAYIDSLAELIAQGVSEFNPSSPPFFKGEKGGFVDILFSAHSLPRSFIDEGDPYLDHINSTIECLQKHLDGKPYNLKNLKYHLSFQSKTGPVKWLEPSTEEKIMDLAKEGVKDLFVVPISFVSDHIETLYEIDILYKDMAEEQGIKIKRCESLNTSDKFILALKELVTSGIEKGNR